MLKGPDLKKIIARIRTVEEQTREKGYEQLSEEFSSLYDLIYDNRGQISDFAETLLDKIVKQYDDEWLNDLPQKTEKDLVSEVYSLTYALRQTLELEKMFNEHGESLDQAFKSLAENRKVIIKRLNAKEREIAEQNKKIKKYLEDMEEEDADLVAIEDEIIKANKDLDKISQDKAYIRDLVEMEKLDELRALKNRFDSDALSVIELQEFNKKLAKFLQERYGVLHPELVQRAKRANVNTKPHPFAPKAETLEFSIETKDLFSALGNLFTAMAGEDNQAIESSVEGLVTAIGKILVPLLTNLFTQLLGQESPSKAKDPDLSVPAMPKARASEPAPILHRFHSPAGGIAPTGSHSAKRLPKEEMARIHQQRQQKQQFRGMPRRQRRVRGK